MSAFGTSARKTAVIEDLDGFMAWLATTPLIMSASNKNTSLSLPAASAPPKPSSGADAEFLAALKSMA